MFSWELYMIFLLFAILCIGFFLAVLLHMIFMSYNAIFIAKPRALTPERHHRTKQNIPTMGGIVLVGTISLLLILCSPWISLPVLGATLWILLGMSLLGAWDDWRKIKRADGIAAKTKFLLQNLLAVGGVLIWYGADSAATVLWIPYFNWAVSLGIIMIPWAVFVLVGTSNAVNLTDGLDGLATTVLILCYTMACGFAFVCGDQETAMIAAITIGTLCGFLLFNWYPARIFMGDTGSLALGALLGFLFIRLGMSLLLPLIGIVLVCETMSVILQTISYKWYKKRIFKMAPLHHHFELSGFSETTIVYGAVACTLFGSFVALIVSLGFFEIYHVL
jgi:phospho-N-acetylmuramoyl-pentapeptide-transferase